MGDVLVLPISDNGVDKPISRQRRWQLKQQMLGRCEGCGGKLEDTTDAYCWGCQRKRKARIAKRKAEKNRKEGK